MFTQDKRSGERDKVAGWVRVESGVARSCISASAASSCVVQSVTMSVDEGEASGVAAGLDGGGGGEVLLEVPFSEGLGVGSSSSPSTST